VRGLRQHLGQGRAQGLRRRDAIPLAAMREMAGRPERDEPVDGERIGPRALAAGLARLGLGRERRLALGGRIEAGRAPPRPAGAPRLA
jgi:hypothetical protein